MKEFDMPIKLSSVFTCILLIARTCLVLSLLIVILISRGTDATPLQKPLNMSSLSDSTVTNSSSPPQLIAEGKLAYPIELLKAGIEGTAQTQLEIDKYGKVVSYEIIKGLHPLLDSAILSAMRQSVFSPAIENDKPIEATIQIEMIFNSDSIAQSSGTVEPDIEGVVLEQGSGLPVKGALVNMMFDDPILDTALRIPLINYLKIIGIVPFQNFHNGCLSTKTDSSGKFSFRLLPYCPVKVAVIAPGFEIAHFYEIPKARKRTNVTYLLSIAEDESSRIEIDSSYAITVYGVQQNQERVDVEKRQTIIGLTHYLSQIVLAKGTIRQVPESGSSMLVRSAGPFDNRYIINGIPMLAPFHFAGHPYADIDGTMISALKSVDIITDRLAGRFSDVNGVVVQANPGVYRPAEVRLKARPELSVAYSTLGQDFLLSFPFKKKPDDFIQIAYSRSETSTFKWLLLAMGRTNRPFPDLGPGFPNDYGNVTLTGIIKGKVLDFAPFFWFAYDNYVGQESKIIPWGMGSIRLNERKENGISAVVGGSRQFYIQGKGYGPGIYENDIYQSNGYLKLHKPLFIHGFVDFDLDGSVDATEWTGNLTRRERDQSDYDTLLKRDNRELTMQGHSYIRKQLGDFNLGLDLLGAGILYKKKNDFYADAGISATWTGDNFSAELHSGRVTSRPDIRGLPDSQLRRQLLNSYLSSAKVSYFADTSLVIHVEPYLRVQPNSPRINPYTCVWDTARFTKLIAYGVDLSGESRPFKWLGLTWAFNAAHGYRDSASVQLPYEWEVPWTARAGTHIYAAGGHMHFMLDGTISKGLPYFDLGHGGSLSRIPVNYNRVDFGFEYRTGQLSHRYLTRYDVYFRVQNILGATNVRDYYWDDNFRQSPIFLRPLLVEIGARFGFRL